MSDFWTDKCPGCSSTDRRATGFDGVWECFGCGGVYGVCTTDVALNFVALKRDMVVGGDSPLFYFDFKFTDTSSRVHGWAKKASGRVVQYG